MINHTKRADLFPTFIFESMAKDPEALNATICAAIYEERALDMQGIERSNFAQLGGWHSQVALHQKPEFALLARVVRDACQNIASELRYAPSARLDIDAMWAIINQPGASNRAHIHPGSLWSGVYYVAAAPRSGSIEFTDPRSANLMQQPQYADRPGVCDPAKLYEPLPGRLLIFPSWLYHMVHPNLSQEDRVIVSFNLSIC